MVKENEWIDISKSKNIAEAKHLNDLIKNKKSKIIENCQCWEKHIGKRRTIWEQ